MSLWELPNFEKTWKEADKFLRTYPYRFARMAGVNLTSLSSPQLSLAPAHSSAVNHQEQSLMKGLHAEEALVCIMMAIQKTDVTSQEILFRYYIKHEKVWVIERDCHIAKNSFKELREIACAHFAETWEYAQDDLKWPEEDRIHLQVYDDQ